MKTVSGFVAIFGIAMVINAAAGKWAFHRVTTGVVYVALDAAIALGCFVVSYRLWRRATHEELTLRINTPVGEWLNDADHKRFWAYYDEAVAAQDEEDALERMLLTFVNTAQFAIGHLAGLTGRTSQEWLQQIAVEMRPPPGST